MKPLINNATEIILLIFLIITFLQSGVDKISDWKGNLSWLKEHFSKSPLKNSVPLLLGIVLITEMIAALLCIGGIYQLLAENKTVFAFYGALFSCISLLMLLFGQRMAKDYEGAKTIAIYFIPAMFLLFLLQ
ncbi:DoxX family protein [Cellulophaga sp. E16_2]|uniref:DoxX family protein n=1 Tax=Cellulophaga algicola (strain DSM 14237 / IC166 / ACAM 630) TaxID=688270 RepID=E6XAB6_CELAD|nr:MULTISPECIES: hypothetical protein [Cellulophaga]ADV48815.1 hypothetical protein Celal_1503 [Cellulophaga algicola DSM 14237]MBO0591287.1 DoxX family protein [Cellulophaga sp. E16_2]